MSVMVRCRGVSHADQCGGERSEKGEVSVRNRAPLLAPLRTISAFRASPRFLSPFGLLR